MPKRAAILFLLFVVPFTNGLAQQPKLMLPIGHSERIVVTRFSPDGKLVVTVSTDGTAKLWEANSGLQIRNFKSAGDASIVLVTDAWFSPGGKKIVINYEGQSHRIYDIAGGQLTGQIINLNNKEFSYIDNAGFSPDNKKLLMISVNEGRLWVLDIETMKPAFIITSPGGEITNYSYSNDGKKLFTVSADHLIRIWNATNGKLLATSARIADQDQIDFSWDDKRILVSSEKKWWALDATTAKLLRKGDGEQEPADIYKGMLTKILRGGKISLNLYNYTDYYDGIVENKYWDSLVVGDIRSGKILYALDNIRIASGSNFLSPDSSKLLVLKKDGTVTMVDVVSGKQLFAVGGEKEEIYLVSFSNDGKKFLTSAGSNAVKIWDAQSGQLQMTLDQQPSKVFDARFSPDDKKIIIGSDDAIGRIWDIASKKLIAELKGRAASLLSAKFDSTGKNIIILTTHIKLLLDIENNKLSIIDTTAADIEKPDWHSDARGDGEIYGDTLVLVWVADIIGVENMRTNEVYNYWNAEKEINNAVWLSPDHKKLLATTANNTIKLYDIKQSKPILTFAVIDSLDYLLVDSSYRYDGTEAARKLLYFTCGKEIVELDQVKDQLWVPGLARRVNRGETINARSIEELSICGLTPLVEQGTGLTGEFYFKIKPRSGGLGETVISFNGTPTLSIQPSQLKKVGNAYELRLFKKDLSSYFITGQENSIAIKTYTANNNSSSRPLIIIDDAGKEKSPPPNLFGVMVGVSNYKGDKMDLEYAAVDAKGISSTVADAAKKLLGNDHVFMYSLTTDSGYLFPEKKAIKRTFDEIASKAGPNDILFIFLSGHGVMHDKTKQFYYMTADASSLSDESLFKDVGLSMTELTEWIKPQKIKAQKRILILDACKSGQAINNMLPDQPLLAVRGDNDAQQVKAIDKLNERSGLFILSASTSGQVAFESGIYGHGYLTFSLLKVIKEKPDILEDGKYLNVSRWFNTAAQTVSEITKQDPTRQEPQIVTNTDFNVGLVDNEVIAKINLSEEAKTLFASGNFLNIAIGDDDLGLRKLIDKKLEEIAREETDKKIVFISSTTSPEAYSLAGGYSVNENSVTLKINLKKGDQVKHRYELAGTKDKLHELAYDIITKAIEWVDASK